MVTRHHTTQPAQADQIVGIHIDTATIAAHHFDPRTAETTFQA